MRLYIIMNPPAGDDATALPMAVKEGFSWPAFFFGPFWLLWHRLWPEAAGVGIAALATLALPPAAGLAASFLLALLLGLEGNALRRWALRRRGWREADIIAAASADEALTLSMPAP